MGLGDLTLVLVGRDALAEQLCVHLEHRGADLERATTAEALDTIRVAVPDLVILSADAAKSDAERIRDALFSSAAAREQAPRLLVLCDKALGLRLSASRYAFLGALEAELGPERIASSIESLCALLADREGAGREPLRALIARVQKSHVPARVVIAGKLKAPPPAAGAARKTQPMLVAPPPAMAQPVVREVVTVRAPALVAPAPIAIAPVPIALAPAPVVIAPAPVAVAPAFESSEIAVDFASLAPPALPPESAIETAASLSPSQPFERESTPLSVTQPMRSPLPAPAVLSRLRRPQQLALAAAALVCLGAVGVAASRGDQAERAPLASAAAVSMDAVSSPRSAAAAKPKVVLVPAPVRAHAPMAQPSSVATGAPAAPAALPPYEETSADAADDGSESGDEAESGVVDPLRAQADRLVNAGHRLRKQGRLGMAEASYLKALAVMPKYARAMSGLVLVHLSRRDRVEALRWANKLVQLQPLRGVHHRLLGDAYALTGASAPARKAWQQAARLGDRTARSRM